MITSKLQINRHHVLFKNGVRVGEVWHWPNSRTFGLRINGWYWSPDGQPNQMRGYSTTSVKTLREAKEVTEKVLNGKP